MVMADHTNDLKMKELKVRISCTNNSNDSDFQEIKHKLSMAR